MGIRIHGASAGAVDLREMAAMGLLLAVCVFPAMAGGDTFRSLDSVGGAEPSSLDAVSNSEPSSLDAVPSAEPSSLDAVPSAEPSGLDAIPHSRPSELEAVPAGRTRSLDPLPVAEGALPESAGGDGQLDSIAPHQREAFESARKAMSSARARLDAANAAYSNMMARDYPRGEAKAAIIAERNAARAAYAQASADFRDLGGEVPAARAER